MPTGTNLSRGISHCLSNGISYSETEASSDDRRCCRGKHDSMRTCGTTASNGARDDAPDGRNAKSLPALSDLSHGPAAYSMLSRIKTTRFFIGSEAGNGCDLAQRSRMMIKMTMKSTPKRPSTMPMIIIVLRVVCCNCNSVELNSAAKHHHH